MRRGVEIGDIVFWMDELWEIKYKTKWANEIIGQNLKTQEQKVLRDGEITQATPVDIIRCRKKTKS